MFSALIGTKYQAHVGANICGDSYARGRVGIYFSFKSKLNEGGGCGGGLAEGGGGGGANAKLMSFSVLHGDQRLLLISSSTRARRQTRQSGLGVETSGFVYGCVDVAGREHVHVCVHMSVSLAGVQLAISL